MAQKYAENIYPVLEGSVGKFMNLFPFSVIEVFFYVAAFIFLRDLFRAGKGKEKFSDVFSGLYLLVAVLITLYTFFCGINLYRTPFSQEANMGREAYSDAELKEMLSDLEGEMAFWSEKVPRGKDGLMCLPENIRDQAQKNMVRMGNAYAPLEGYYPKPKFLLGSWFLSCQGLTGMYSVFTIEANVNGAMTPYNVPFTMCHELSHLKGFMLEDEANFIAFVSCRTSSDPAFRYSGAMLGWLYTAAELEKRVPGIYNTLYERLPESVRRDYAANGAFWEKYETHIMEAAQEMNNAYLKSTGQKGLESYDRVVDLMVQYYRQRKKR